MGLNWAELICVSSIHVRPELRASHPNENIPSGTCCVQQILESHWLQAAGEYWCRSRFIRRTGGHMKLKISLEQCLCSKLLLFRPSRAFGNASHWIRPLKRLTCQTGSLRFQCSPVCFLSSWPSGSSLSFSACFYFWFESLSPPHATSFQWLLFFRGHTHSSGSSLVFLSLFNIFTPHCPFLKSFLSSVVKYMSFSLHLAFNWMSFLPVSQGFLWCVLHAFNTSFASPFLISSPIKHAFFEQLQIKIWNDKQFISSSHQFESLSSRYLLFSTMASVYSQAFQQKVVCKLRVLFFPFFVFF